MILEKFWKAGSWQLCVHPSCAMQVTVHELECMSAEEQELKGNVREVQIRSWGLLVKVKGGRP